jgi:glycolate oxidase iron-sulfur subunit
MCNATCPTYQLLGDELDGPRGRIYLIKQVLEGQAPGRRTQLHLDRCLTCRNCEVTCPSGVRYGALLEIGREIVEKRVSRSFAQRSMHRLLRWIIPHPARFAPLLRLGRFFRPILPSPIKRAIPRGVSGRARPAGPVGAGPDARHKRRMLVLEGCVQPSIAPHINAAAARVLSRLGISLLSAEGAGCCGALSHHLAATDEALTFARRNVDAWWPYVESGIEAIVMTASGCGVHVKDYGRLLRDDAAYAKKSARIAELTLDLCEVLGRENLSVFDNTVDRSSTVAFHPPCTLQHGQRLNGTIEQLLTHLGFTLTPVPDTHLCCGSAGTFSILQGKLARQLLRRKLDALESGKPDVIVTANIGCMTHLQTRASVPVRHWIELLDGAH